ncbi:hypothetical protein HG570_05905 [Helicobacter pylori]|nr:hypothetical protein [Helicobacter pylori]QQW84049.1 hypothetical protein HG570_05905 [Helicobacter pylori]
MGSIGSMGKPIEGFLVAAIQFPVPIVNSRKDIDHNIESIIRTLHATKAGYPGVELIIFPEYSTQGLNTAKILKALLEPCMRLKRGIREWNLSFSLNIARKV